VSPWQKGELGLVLLTGRRVAAALSLDAAAGHEWWLAWSQLGAVAAGCTCYVWICCCTRLAEILCVLAKGACQWLPGLCCVSMQLSLMGIRVCLLIHLVLFACVALLYAIFWLFICCFFEQSFALSCLPAALFNAKMWQNL
jgi:hypothetical protein